MIEPCEHCSVFAQSDAPPLSFRQRVPSALRDQPSLLLSQSSEDVQLEVCRIGHLGDCNALMLLAALGGTELALHDAGIDVPYGAGVAAAQRWYHESA